MIGRLDFPRFRTSTPHYWQLHISHKMLSSTFCDELGYLSLDQHTSNLFYQVISTRHAERRSTVITTNTIFSEWGNILFNTTIAAAIADRLVENSEVFLLGGPTWRNPKNGQTAPQQ